MNFLIEFIPKLRERRRQLKMPFEALAIRSGLSLRTVKRLLSKEPGEVSFNHVAAVADALGLPIGKPPMPIKEMVDEQAHKQALRLAGMVQGTMGLESQALVGTAFSTLVEEGANLLKSKYGKKLWFQ